MLRITLWLLVGVFVWGFASSVICPDGKVCPDIDTCCKTPEGYGCCPYPNAVCCPDLNHCCPSGFRCNQVTQMCEKGLWIKIPMVPKEAAEEPSPPVLASSPVQELENNLVPEQQKASVVRCDSYYTCPDRTTCCRHPTGVWFCCLYYPGRCCLDGFHCCPYGYDCDLTYTHCIREGLRYPFTPKHSLASFPASLLSISDDESSFQGAPMTALTKASDANPEVGLIRCDARFYCQAGKTCCRSRTGRWNCCPYALGECCADGRHCCMYGYKCDSTSMSCTRKYHQILSGSQEDAKTL